MHHYISGIHSKSPAHKSHLQFLANSVANVFRITNVFRNTRDACLSTIFYNSSKAKIQIRPAILSLVDLTVLCPLGSCVCDLSLSLCHLSYCVGMTLVWENWCLVVWLFQIALYPRGLNPPQSPGAQRFTNHYIGRRFNVQQKSIVIYHETLAKICILTRTIEI